MQSALRFQVSRRSAWAPGLTNPAAWDAWAAAPQPPLPVGGEAPALAEVPAMTRRRLERLGRLVFQVAASTQGEDRGAPLLFASRHGDPGRAVELLSALARGEALSPTSFGLSVHNGVAGQYSIFRKDTSASTALAAGACTAEAGFVEAAGLLADGHPEVVLVVYDLKLPGVLAPFADEPQADYAWAVRLTTPRPGPAVTLTRTAPAPTTGPATLPHGLEVLRFLLTAGPDLGWASPAGGWHWRHTR